MSDIFCSSIEYEWKLKNFLEKIQGEDDQYIRSVYVKRLRNEKYEMTDKSNLKHVSTSEINMLCVLIHNYLLSYTQTAWDRFVEFYNVVGENDDCSC